MNTRHRYFMRWYHHYTDIAVHWTWYYMLHWPLLVHLLVIHRYVTRIIATQICYTDTRIHRYSLVYMHWLFIYILATCIFLPVISLHDCLLLLLLILSLLDMSDIDTRCVKLSATWISATGPPLESHISCITFLVILFHDINKAHVLLSYNLYHALF